MLLFAFSAKAENDNSGNPIVIAAFGDSLMSGYRLPPDDGFAPVLQKQLQSGGLNATVINASEAGIISAEARARVAWMLEDKPDMVIVEVGANDMLRFLPVAQMRENLDAIIATIKQSGARVLIAGMYASTNLGGKYRMDFRRAYAEVADKHGVLLYPFFLQDVYDSPGRMLPDGKHPNAEGVRVMAKNIAPLVIQTLNT